MSQGVSMKRRKIDPETKMVAALEGLRGEYKITGAVRPALLKITLLAA
jgi:hypothetical protein